MAFEYSSQNRGIDFPNPLKMHNRFLVAAFAILAIFAVALLVSVRTHLAVSRSAIVFPVVFFVALPLLAASINNLYGCLSHLRFFFGLDRPMGLARELAADGQGTSPYVEQYVKEPLRQQAIKYREPKGPITGLLYSLVPKLIYAPEPLRLFAEWQFKSGLTLIALLIGLICALIFGVPNQAGQVSYVADWTGVFFLLIGVVTLLRQHPSAQNASPDSGFLSIGGLSGLIAGVIVAPMIVSLLLPNLFNFWTTSFGLPQPSPFPHIFLFLLAGIAVQGLFFAATIAQLLPPPPTAVSVVQDTWSLSTSPSQITGEFARAMQESWNDKIPNRRYARIEPVINLNAGAGPFRAEIIEESQPVPRILNAASQEQVSPSGSRKLILALESIGVVFAFGAGLSAYLLGNGLLETGTYRGNALLYALACGSLSSYALGAARFLLLRFDFSSRLYWLELNGQYNLAKVKLGNVIQGNLGSDTTAVQVEGMTFRLWMAELHSVTFGKDAPRYILSMAGNPVVAEGLAQRLKQYTSGVATVFALNNSANAERLAANNMLADQPEKLAPPSTEETVAAMPKVLE